MKSRVVAILARVRFFHFEKKCSSLSTKNINMYLGHVREKIVFSYSERKYLFTSEYTFFGGFGLHLDGFKIK